MLHYEMFRERQADLHRAADRGRLARAARLARRAARKDATSVVVSLAHESEGRVSETLEVPAARTERLAA